jgi:hypothetical protein
MISDSTCPSHHGHQEATPLDIIRLHTKLFLVGKHDQEALAKKKTITFSGAQLSQTCATTAIDSIPKLESISYKSKTSIQ